MAASKYRCVIVSDSRGSKFPELGNFNQGTYSTHYLSYRGAKIPFLRDRTVEFLSKQPKDCFFIVILCAGINELTRKIQHDGGTEIALNSNQILIINLLRFKEKVRADFPNSLVTIASIPIIDIIAANAHYVNTGRLCRPMLTETELDSLQLELSDTLRIINNRIFTENKHQQYIPGKGLVLPNQIYLHQYVEKMKTKVLKNGRKIIKRRISPTALIDGIHPSVELTIKWLQGIHENALKQYNKLHCPAAL